LDSESERFVATAVAEAARMGRLVDGLLALSRLGRADLNSVPVALAELVEGVRSEFADETAGRVITWKIGVLPKVYGDPVLLRQVVANLVGNAVKFTRRRPEAEIEIGVSSSRPGDSALTFYVRDNGAGFNPKYADKLFGISTTAQRPRLRRHGDRPRQRKTHHRPPRGKVSAEGAIDQGATFYFTLAAAETSVGGPDMKVHPAHPLADYGFGGVGGAGNAAGRRARISTGRGSAAAGSGRSARTLSPTVSSDARGEWDGVSTEVVDAVAKVMKSRYQAHGSSRPGC